MAIFTILESERPTLRCVSASARDEVVVAFVQTLIRDWLAKNGGKQKDLAVRASMSPAQMSNIINGNTGVWRSLDGLARVFHFADRAALVAAAHEWRRGEAGNAAELMKEPAVLSAIEIVRGARSDVSVAQIRTILYAFGHDRFRGRDTDFWVKELLDELQLEREISQRDRAERNEAARDKRARKTQVQGSMRAGHRRRREAAAAAAVASAEPPIASERKPARKAAG